MSHKNQPTEQRRFKKDEIRELVAQYGAEQVVSAMVLSNKSWETVEQILVANHAAKTNCQCHHDRGDHK